MTAPVSEAYMDWASGSMFPEDEPSALVFLAGWQAGWEEAVLRDSMVHALQAAYKALGWKKDRDAFDNAALDLVRQELLNLGAIEQ